MKICEKCFHFYQEQMMTCTRCKSKLVEVSLSQALKLTETRAFRSRIEGKKHQTISDAHKQYHIRSYLGNRSLFLDYDIQKNRLKHGRRLKRFFIAPVDFTALVNIPWFFFNIISSNIFHILYTQYCTRCHTKYIKGRHTEEDCNYNIEYFNILNDILSGCIAYRKKIYQKFAQEKRARNIKSAYFDLFYRKIRWEAFWDVVSIGLSLTFWLFIAIYVSYPMFKVLMLKIADYEAYEWGLPIEMIMPRLF